MRLLRWSCSSIADGLYALSLQRPSSLAVGMPLCSSLVVLSLAGHRRVHGAIFLVLPNPIAKIVQAYDVTMSAILVALMAYSAALWSAANEQGVSSMGSLLRDVCVSEASMGPLIAVSMPL